jgi:hypothetical protein
MEGRQPRAEATATAVWLDRDGPRARRGDLMRPPLMEIQCARCGTWFMPSKRGHRFCSSDCRYQGEREPRERPPADPEQVARLFDESRDPEEPVRPDDWTATPQFAHLDTFHTVGRRRRWHQELKDRGML